MKHQTPDAESPIDPPNDLLERLWKESWTHIKTVVDVDREPIVILGMDLRVLTANEQFYKTFQVDARETTKQLFFELGNGQWNNLKLRKLLEDILPKNKHFKGFEIIHKFPVIGRRVMILNARQIHFKGGDVYQPIILLAIEDVTDMMNIAKSVAGHTNEFDLKLMERTEGLVMRIFQLQKEIDSLKIHANGA